MDNSLTILSAAVSERGLSEKRPQNEDSYLEMGRSGLFAVADGVGGAQAGEVASQMAMEILGEAFANFAGGDAEPVMRSAIEQANAAIHQMAQELPQLANMATTIVALHIAGNVATIGHVGDSRLYRVDRDGMIYRETADHSMVADEVRAGRMTEEQAENHPSRNIISRALGAEPTVVIDLKTIMIGPGMSFLICSDGVTRHVSDQEIQGVLTFGGEAGEVCEYLKNLCYERGAEDNLTAVVVKAVGEATHDLAGDALELGEDEDPTVASPRMSSYDKTIPYDDDDDSILELETGSPAPKGAAAAYYGKPDFGVETLSLSEEETLEVGEDTLALEDTDSVDIGSETIPIFTPGHELRPATDPNISIPATVESVPEITERAAEPDRSFPMFQNSVMEEGGDHGSMTKIVTAAAMLLLGALIGLGVYHFALAQKPVEAPVLTEAKTNNIPQTTFENTRRTVDKDPAAYLKELAPPEDALDYYLRGRASLLTGDLAKAKSDLTEAQSRLIKVDESNAKILATDIATALVVANDPAAYAKFKENLTPKPPGNTNAAANTNTANKKP